ncbi:hypothetical protein H114_30637 [Streptomyces gancidicus BKS 13-15]|uniref:Uncharacterized protein n=1 Tax=Streptomyces gancidicus BKS 13-15 TaxID=1284664 RepID=M3CXL1_STREZ|nr:hypothetical protein H114_30637 [Streptomyces gancidicus BKS 13-15]
MPCRSTRSSRPGEALVELGAPQTVETLGAGVALFQQPGLTQYREMAAEGRLGDRHVEASA